MLQGRSLGKTLKMGSMDRIGHNKNKFNIPGKTKQIKQRSTCKRWVHPSRSCSQTCGQGGLGHPHPGQQLSPSCYPICFNRRVIGAHLASSNFASKQERNNLFPWFILDYPAREAARQRLRHLPGADQLLDAERPPSPNEGPEPEGWG